MDLTTFRLGQINILNSIEGRPARYALLGRELNREGIEVVAIQEVVDGPLLRQELANAGFAHYAEATPLQVMGDVEPDGVALASRYPIVNSSEIEFGGDLRNGLHCEFLLNGVKVHVLVAHFAWGGDTEAVRLRQAETIDRLARKIRGEERYAAVLFAGDLNTEDQSRTARFLRGLDLGTSENSTYWTDAYLVAGKPEHWATSDHSQGILGPTTAVRFGVKLPQYLPARRIDYILSFGWQYGKTGCPVNFHRFGEAENDGELELSDHYGLWADVLL